MAMQPKDGWYKPGVIDLIRELTRIKYMYLREKGEPAPDHLCDEAIADFERTRRQQASTSGEEDANME